MFILSCFLSVPAQAKDKDYEDEKVKVTLKSGEVVKGYLKTHWFGLMKKELNTRFSIVSEPKGKDVRKFTTAFFVWCVDIKQGVTERKRFFMSKFV